MSEIYDIEELPEGTFPLSFNIIHRYQREDPFLMEELNGKKHQKGSFYGGWNTILLITYKNKIVIPQKIQKYVVNWYHMYLLNPELDRTEATIRHNLY